MNQSKIPKLLEKYKGRERQWFVAFVDKNGVSNENLLALIEGPHPPKVFDEEPKKKKRRGKAKPGSNERRWKKLEDAWQQT